MCVCWLASSVITDGGHGQRKVQAIEPFFLFVSCIESES